jgi:hypothetical protein
MNSNTFDITIGISELNKIIAEEKRLQHLLKGVRAHKKTVEEKIETYLKNHNHNGVMLNNVIVEKKIIERAKPLSKLEKEKCIEKVLKDNNIGGADQIISDINKQSTGIKITKTKIAITQNK